MDDERHNPPIEDGTIAGGTVEVVETPNGKDVETSGGTVEVGAKLDGKMDGIS
jgi:hypothetical protein